MIIYKKREGIKLKIAIDLTSLADNFSGIERYALNISREMIKNDTYNEYILLFKNSIHPLYNQLLEDKKVKPVIIQGNNKLIFGQLTLAKELYRIKADKYIFLAFPSPVLFRKKGIINTIHDLTAWDYPKTMKFLSKMYFKLGIRNAVKVSERILTVSEFSKRRIIEKFKIENISIIYNGISDVFLKSSMKMQEKNLSDLKEKYKLPDSYLMCLCTLEPRKNIELLIKAYVELRNKNKISEKLVLVGRKGWKVEKLLNDINNNYIEDIIITGFVDDEDLPLIYSEAKCFIFPSLYEGFGIPVIEAMYMNVPVICSNTSSLPEVINGCGILFENNNIEDLKDKILAFLNSDEKEFLSVIKMARKRAEKFNWHSEAHKLIELL